MRTIKLLYFKGKIMPHCLIEHSVTIDSKSLLPVVFTGTLNSNLFEPDGSDIKVRAIPYESYLVGKDKQNFIHIVLKILSGRSIENKEKLSNSVLTQLQTLELKDCSITVEVVDIDKSCYAKVVNSI